MQRGGEIVRSEFQVSATNSRMRDGGSGWQMGSGGCRVVSQATTASVCSMSSRHSMAQIAQTAAPESND